MAEGDNSYYANAVERPRDRYEDYIVKDLISDVEAKFPVAAGRSNRAIAGVSMGGFGAVNLSLKHSDLFAFAAGISSAIDVPSRPFSIKRISQYRGHAAIFGSWDSQTRHDNDPFILVRKATEASRAPYLYLACGDQEGLLKANLKFANLLQQQQFHFEFHSGPGGHDWNQWNGRLEGVLKACSIIRVSRSNES